MSDNCTPAPDEDLAILLENLACTIRTPAPVVGNVKPVVAWQGGKRWLVQELLPLIPAHKMYVELYDSKQAVFFCDPPYTTGLAHYGAWTIDDLANFREQGLDQMKGTWILTIDDTPANRGLFKDCFIKSFTRKNGISHKVGEKASEYHELIIRPRDGRHKR